MLIIVVDHDKGFVGSRHVEELRLGKDDVEIKNILNREFPKITQDDVLFIEDDKIIGEWFGGLTRHR